MKHYRWIQAKWPILIRHLADRMRERLFIDEAPEGFIIDAARRNSIEGRFIQYNRSYEIVFDPFGREKKNDITTYSQLGFTITDNFPQIEIWDPPRSQQRFLTLLSDFTDFALAISSIEMDVLEWSRRFCLVYDEKFFIDQIHVSHLDLGRGNTAKLVATGKSDVGTSISDILQGQNYSMNKIRLKSLSRPADYVVITNSGSARIQCIRQDAVRSALKTSMKDIITSE